MKNFINKIQECAQHWVNDYQDEKLNYNWVQDQYNELSSEEKQEISLNQFYEKIQECINAIGNEIKIDSGYRFSF